MILLIFLHAWSASVERALELFPDHSSRGEWSEEDRIASACRNVVEHSGASQLSLRVFRSLCGMLAAGLTAYFLAPYCTRWITQGNGQPTWGMMCLRILLTEICLLLIIRIFACSLPQRLAARRPERVLRRWVSVLVLLNGMMKPLTFCIEKCTRLLLRLRGIDPDYTEAEVTEDDILQMVDMGEESGSIEENEKEMIENIFEFNNLTAEEVMTHRTDVTLIALDDSPETILQTIRESGLSRFPVYGEDMDDIVGILNTRDYLMNICGEHPQPLRAILRQPYFVPEHVQADVLFRNMQRSKVHMSVVIDEYGGMSGIVTMEDLLEQIVGNIYDEFDPQAETEIVRLEDNLWRISGWTQLSAISESLGVSLPESDDFDTLGGLIFSQLTTIPGDGTHPEVDVYGLHIRVEELREHRVEHALVSRLTSEEEKEADHGSEP